MLEFTYKDNMDGTCIITGLLGDQRHVPSAISIPATIKDLCVSAISSQLWDDLKDIESLEIPSTISEPLNKYLRNLGKLRKLTVTDNPTAPKHKQAIDSMLFEKCYDLTFYPRAAEQETVVLRKEHFSLMNDAFFNNSSIKHLIFYGKILVVPSRAISGCNNLRDIVFLNTITKFDLRLLSRLNDCNIYIKDKVSFSGKVPSPIKSHIYFYVSNNDSYSDICKHTHADPHITVWLRSESSIDIAVRSMLLKRNKSQVCDPESNPIKTIEQKGTHESLQESELAEGRLQFLFHIKGTDNTAVLDPFRKENKCTSLTIPRMICGIPVSGISTEFFFDFSKLLVLMIPATIKTKIGSCLKSNKTIRRIILTDTSDSNASKRMSSSSMFEDDYLSFYPPKASDAIVVYRDEIKGVWQDAFHDNPYLKTLIFDADVQSFKKSAVHDCPNLKTIVFTGTVNDFNLKNLNYLNKCKIYFKGGIKNITSIETHITASVEIITSEIHTYYRLKGKLISNPKLKVTAMSENEMDDAIKRIYPGYAPKVRNHSTPWKSEHPLPEKISDTNISSSVKKDIPYIAPDTVVVVGNTWECVTHGHSLKTKSVKIRLLDTHNVLHDETLELGYCIECCRYYIYSNIFKEKLSDKIRIQGWKVIGTQFRTPTGHLIGYNFDSYGNLRTESILKVCGYHVGASSRLSHTERMRILSGIIEKRLLTKQEVLNYLNHFIEVNGKRNANMSLAVSEWKEDMIDL